MCLILGGHNQRIFCWSLQWLQTWDWKIQVLAMEVCGKIIELNGIINHSFNHWTPQKDTKKLEAYWLWYITWHIAIFLSSTQLFTTALSADKTLDLGSFINLDDHRAWRWWLWQRRVGEWRNFHYRTVVSQWNILIIAKCCTYLFTYIHTLYHIQIQSVYICM